MSDTPETDKAERMAYAQEHMVPTEMARKLERERDEAREAAAKWEFDAMERAGAEQARRADENREWALRAERERDEAREALAEAWRFADQWLALADGYLKRINEIQNDIRKN